MNHDDDQLLTDKQAADLLGLKPQSLRKLRWMGGGPAFCRLTRSARGQVRYRLGALRAWIREHEVASTAAETWNGPPPPCAAVGGAR